MKIIFVSKGFEKTSMDLLKCDPEEMIMLVDADRCISCGACEIACQIEHSISAGCPAVFTPMRILNESGDGKDRTLYLPLACRHCSDPCEYYNQYNFWITCPSGRNPHKGGRECDLCAERLKKGFWPVCATKCSMKAIHFGIARDIAFALEDKRLWDMGDVKLEQHSDNK